MGKLGIWDDPGPDRGWSWIIALGTCWITFCTYGVSRSAGVLFVATVETFGVSRQEAAWPFNLAPAVACFTAIIAGFMSRFLTSRQTVLIGAVLCTVGMALCFMAKNIIWMAVCYGIVYGFGLALCVPLLVAILNEYFVRVRATANGIYLSGSTLGLFAIPPLLEYLIGEYGLRGTMLLQAGLVMHIFIGALLLRPRTVQNFPILERCLKNTADEDVKKELLSDHEETQVFIMNDTGSFKLEQTDRTYQLSNNDLRETDSANKNGSHIQSFDSENVVGPVSRKNSRTSIINSRKPSLLRQDTINSIDSHSKIPASIAGSLMLGLDTIDTVIRAPIPEKEEPAIKSTYFTLLRDIFKDPCFYMLLVSGAACIIPLLTFMIVIMDFGMDRGLPRDKAVLLMSAISIPELLGRLCFGWISDKGYLTYKTLFMCTKMLGTAVLLLMPTLGYNAGLFIISGLYGALESCAAIVLNVLFVEYLGLEKLAIAFSWSIFIDGFIFLAMPYVIGLFRDEFGSYDYLFYLLGSLSLLSVVVWFMEPAVMRKRVRIAAATEAKKNVQKTVA